MSDFSILSSSDDETLALGQCLGQCLRSGHIIGLIGELGAGKTCFSRGVVQGLGIPSNVLISSPTFTLINEYPGQVPIYHMDFYRLHHLDELIDIGVDDIFRGSGVCIVEWFDRFSKDFSLDHLQIHFLIQDDNIRQIEAICRGEEYIELGKKWLENYAARNLTGV